MGKDLLLAWRTLTRSPLFSCVAVISLALGIGANSAVFSLVDQVFLRQMPVRSPGELVLVKDPGPYGNGSAWADGDPRSSFSHPVFLELRAASHGVLSGLAARWGISPSVAAGKQGAELVDGEIVSGNYFDVLGVRAAAGRLFTDNDDRQPGAHPVVVLGYDYWQRQFGGQASAVGSEIRINTQTMTIVGVTEARFHGTQPGRFPQFYLPMAMKAAATPGNDNLRDRTYRWLQLIGRLEPGVSMEKAEAAMRIAFRPIVETTLAAQPDLPDDVRAQVRARLLLLEPGAKGREVLRNDSGEALAVLLAMTALVLLGACANVANLMVARGASRAREIAIRFSVGATRGALIRQLLAESLLLSACGGILGIINANWALAGLAELSPRDPGTRTFLTTALDWRAFAITMAVAIATGLLFGLLPAFQSTRSGLTGAMKDRGAASTTARAGVRLRQMLVAVQFSLSLVVLVAGGLLAASLGKLMRETPGFAVDRVASFRLDAAASGHAASSLDAAYLSLRDHLAAVPGVSDLGMTRVAILAGMTWTGRVVDTGCALADHRGEVPVTFNGVDAGFRRLTGGLEEGREFTDADQREKDVKVAIVNRTFARGCYGGRSALGRTLVLGRERKRLTIVGVMPDTRFDEIRSKPTPLVHFPFGQAPGTEATFYVRSTMPESELLAQLQQAVRAFDPGLAISNLATLRAQIDDTLYLQRMGGFMALAFAGISASIAVVGLYGLLAFMVTRRLPEIGVRLALGASRRGVAWLVLREVLGLAGLGLLAGLPMAWLLSGYLRSMLYGLEPSDPRVFAGAVGLLLAAAVLAGLGPSRRALRVDPMRVLRYE